MSELSPARAAAAAADARARELSEAAAVRDVLTDLRAAVGRLPAYEEHDETLGLDLYDPMGVYRAAVLDAIDKRMPGGAR